MRYHQLLPHENKWLWAELHGQSNKLLHLWDKGGEYRGNLEVYHKSIILHFTDLNCKEKSLQCRNLFNMKLHTKPKLTKLNK